MIPIDYRKFTFYEDRILCNEGETVFLKLSDVWAIGYKKPSFFHWLSMKHDWMSMGILYIATKSSMRVKDLIPIRMPYSIVKKLPKSWINKVEFYEFGGDIKIKRIE